MWAPNTPPWAPRRARKRSYSGSATSGRAAATEAGRLPLRASPESVNCGRTSTPRSPSGSFMRPSASANTRSARTLSASRSATAPSSSWVTPSRTSSPGPIAATVSPSTATAAAVTRWTRARTGRTLPSGAMDVFDAVRTRRTHKAYGADPVDRAQLEELFELARWAPNHHLTEPWRFRVVGPRALKRLKAAAGPEAAGKLDRAPTLVVASQVRAPDDPEQDEEDFSSASIAAYLVLLAAHARGLAGYWRTPAVLRTPEGRAA